MAAAINMSRYYCQGMTAAVVWYEECILHYSNKSMFSTLMEEPILYMKNMANVTDPDRFNRTLNGIMDRIRTKVVNDQFGKKYYANRGKLPCTANGTKGV